LQNVDRAMAYAKQRGVEIPEGLRSELQKLNTDDLKYRLRQYNIVLPRKTRKAEMIDRLVVEFLMPALTPAQQRRIRQSHDSKRTLRDRKARKGLFSLRRRMKAMR